MKDAAEANKGPCRFCGAVRDYVARGDRQRSEEEVLDAEVPGRAVEGRAAVHRREH